MVEKYCLAKGRLSLFVLNKANHTRSFFGIIMVLFNSLYLHIIPLLCLLLFRKIILLLVIASATAQVENEIPPPFNIKTVSFIQNDQNVIPIFSLGSGFQLQFDDLYGNEANFYYEIIHCDYNWKPSEIPKRISARF
jgi:hypothetical protein